jgi:hypothetical protein
VLSEVDRGSLKTVVWPKTAQPQGTGAGFHRAGKRGGKRAVAARVTTACAGLLVFLALIAPQTVGQLTPAALVRIPVEGLLGVALVLVLPARARRVVAALGGVVLGLLTILKILDMGFGAVLSRPFDPVLDWSLASDAGAFLTGSIGRAGAIAVGVAAVGLVAGVLTVMTRSVLRLTGIIGRHPTAAIRAVAVLAPIWVACAVLGAQIVTPVPVAARSLASLAYYKARQVPVSLRDEQVFASQVAVDPFQNTPGDKLLTGLRGKDVIFTFVESYGRDAVQDPEFAPKVGAVLDDGNRRLSAAGYASRSAFLTSPVAGGGSWLAHATFVSGQWIDTIQRHHTLVSTDRLTLTSAFQRANWRTVSVMPNTGGPWPEAKFYGYDQVYEFENLGYRGPKFGWATMPDQYTLSTFDRTEMARPGRGPLMGELVLVSSHMPWTPLPRMINWADVRDGSVYGPMAEEGESEAVVWRDRAKVRTQYERSIEYSLNSLISYVETHGNDNLVLVFLGDHQPAPIVTGEGASRDVPITIVARDRAVLDRISGWGWQDGLKPGPDAPVWRMDAFRDRFLTAFGSQPAPPPH